MGPRRDRRAGTLAALASMTAVAVVVAGGLVGWIRLTAPSAGSASTSLTEEVPETFAGGFAPAPVPGAVADAVDGPVVAVVVLDEEPGGAGLCDFHTEGGGDRELVWAVVTPEGLQIAYVSDELPWMEHDMVELEREAVERVEVEATAVPPDEPVPHQSAADDSGPAQSGARYFESCGARWERGGWTAMGGTGMTLPTDGPLPGGIGTSSSCCDDQGFTIASTAVSPVEGAAWLLQDRGGYWLAYPADASGLVPLSWRYRQSRLGGDMRTPSTHVLSVDADGTVLDERFIGG